MSEKLSPERAIRLLRAKANELEAQVLQDPNHQNPLSLVAADIALIASLLADAIEYWAESDARPMLEQQFREGFDEGRP